MMNQLNKALTWLDSERALRLAAILVLLFAVAGSIPSFFVPLGLPPEADAVDYRIPLMKWLLRHHSYPNWPWSYVDDFPMLQEFLMLPFFALGGGLARAVSVGVLILAGIGAGGILAEWMRLLNGPRFRYSTWILVGAAWIVALRPATIQINLLMTDNGASAFALLALWMILQERIPLAGVALGLAMATKYFIWPFAPVMALATAWMKKGKKPVLAVITLGGITTLFALPLMIRNILVNHGNPFYPMMEMVFHPNGPKVEPWLSTYGRGKGIVDFLLLPYDFLITNNWVNGFFDYTVGKLFLAQIIALLLLWFFNGRAAFSQFRFLMKQRIAQACLLFIVAFTITWFITSQQMRFLVAVLAVINVFVIVNLITLARPRWLLCLTLAGVLSLISVQKDSWLVAFGKRPQQFSNELEIAKNCFSQIPDINSKIIGYTSRDGSLGFFDFDFQFVNQHVYAVPISGPENQRPDYIWGVVEAKPPFEAYAPWPENAPCLLKRKS